MKAIVQWIAWYLCNIRHGIARFFLMGDSYMQGWVISGKEGVWPKRLPGAEMRHTTVSDFPVGISGDPWLRHITVPEGGAWTDPTSETSHDR